MRTKLRRFIGHTMGSLLSGLVVGGSVLGVVTWDDIRQNYDGYTADRAAFYAWVLRFPVMAGGLSATVSYFFLPELLRRLAKERSLSEKLREFAESRIEAGDDPERVAEILLMAEQAEKVNA